MKYKDLEGKKHCIHKKTFYGMVGGRCVKCGGYLTSVGINIKKGGKMEPLTLSNAGMMKSAERLKRKPRAININKITNGYLVSPQGVYPDSELASVYVEKLEDIAGAIETAFNTEV